MSQMTDGPVKTFLAGEALEAFRRVKLSSGKVVYADQADSNAYIGVTTEACADGAYVGVRLLNANGTQKCVAADTFTANAALYAANDGKVSDSSSGNRIGTSLEACTTAGDVVECLLDYGGSATALTRDSIAQDDLQPYVIPLTQLRTWDALATNLPATAGNDDMGLVTGTPGTHAPTVVGADAGGTTATNKAGFLFSLPPEYQDGETVTLRVNAAMAVISDKTATLDATVYDLAAPSSDICATAAQSINSATAANKDFTITPTNLVAGDQLFVVLTTAVTDSGDAAPNINAVINSVSLLLDIRC